MKKSSLFIASIFLFSVLVYAQKEGDVIINEVGNGGTKKAMYSGGDYVELLVLRPEGVKLAGWYLTDLSSPGGTPKETEGYIKFSDKEGSLFNQVLPKGTYILICLGDPQSKYGAENVKEVTDRNHIVVFAGESNLQIEKAEGTIVLTGKDNIALVSSWEKNSAIDVVMWQGSTSWVGCEVTQLSLESLENGIIAYFTPSDGNFKDNSSPQNWISVSDENDATSGSVNKDVDDSSLRK